LGDKVEVLHVPSKRWYKLTDLPHPLHLPSATICGNQLYVIGDFSNGYSCSLEALPSADKPTASQFVPNVLSWNPLPILPVRRSTAATLCGQLVTVGGWQQDSPVNSIYQLVDKGHPVMKESCTHSITEFIYLSISHGFVL
jgi:hypothetical protein